MKIKVQKDNFSSFLLPVSRISDANISCAIHVESDYLYVVAHDASAVCIYYAKHTPVKMEDIKEPFVIYVSDIRKVINAIDVIDEDEIVLDITSKFISYESPTIKFKCYLLDPAVAAAEKISAKMIDAFKFDTEFVMNTNTFSKINKGCTFTDNKGKIYFYTNAENKKVYVDLDDKSANHSVNNITFIAADGYIGSDLTPTSPLSIDTFKIISALKHDVQTKVNIAKGAYMFYYRDGNTEIKYLLRALKS
jgi:hypothetical protein